MPCKCSAILLIATVLASAAWSQQPPTSVSYDSNAPLPAIVPANRPAIGLALEGGGALGLAHVGVLQWLEEHRIPIDRLSGTSMGALVGALYATGATPAQMRAVAVSDAFVTSSPSKLPMPTLASGAVRTAARFPPSSPSGSSTSRRCATRCSMNAASMSSLAPSSLLTIARSWTTTGSQSPFAAWPQT